MLKSQNIQSAIITGLGFFIGSLLGLACSFWTGNESVVIGSYALGSILGVVTAAIIGRRWKSQNRKTEDLP